MSQDLAAALWKSVWLTWAGGKSGDYLRVAWLVLDEAPLRLKPVESVTV